MIDTLIIGGGAAGLYASSLLPEAAILERNEADAIIPTIALSRSFSVTIMETFPS